MADWIWANKKIIDDQHVDFKISFLANKNNKYSFNIACNSIFCFYLNKKLIGFGRCSDYPEYKYFDNFDLTNNIDFNKENTIDIKVWYFNHVNSTVCTANAGLWFELYENNKLINFSNSKTQSRIDTNYKEGHAKFITGQLGYTYLYDFNKKELEFNDSIIQTGLSVPVLRPIKPLEYKDNIKLRLIKNNKSSRVYALDIEEAGFLGFKINAQNKTNLKIKFGEHLVNNSIYEDIHGRYFAFDFILKKGLNCFEDNLRYSCFKYIEVFSDSPIEIEEITIKPIYYPIKWNLKKLDDPEHQLIYNACINSLNLCMHEHYEDCPWREQALYTFDSKIEMEIGYFLFDSFEYQRYNLLLQSRGLQKDSGLLSLTFPTSLELTIPAFSLYYIESVYNYVQYTKDTSIIEDVRPALVSIFVNFKNHIDKNHLISKFESPHYWDFYEWTKYSDGSYNADLNCYSFILNALFIYICPMYECLTGEHFDTASMRTAIHKTFYNKETKNYNLYSECCNVSSELSTSLAILTDLLDKNYANKLLSDKTLYESTVVQKYYVYKAILKGNIKAESVILQDIKNIFLPMAKETQTVWETKNGFVDFDGAASLCHGWSAVPIYFYEKFKMTK